MNHNQVMRIDNPPVAIININSGQHNEKHHDSYENLRQVPIVGKTALEHSLDEIMATGIRQAIILADKNAGKIQKWVGNGERWSIDLNIEIFRYSLEHQQILDIFSPLSEPHGLLVIDAQKLRSQFIAKFITIAKQCIRPVITAHLNGSDIGLSYLTKTQNEIVTKNLELSEKEIYVNQLASMSDYFNANLDALNGKFTGIQPKAKQINNSGLFRHHHTFIHSHCRMDNNVMIGEHCHVSKNTQLKNVVLNNDIYVDKNSKLENVIVLPSTYIGKSCRIRNAVITADKIINIST